MLHCLTTPNTSPDSNSRAAGSRSQRTLLALNGATLNHELQVAAVRYFSSLRARIDILVVNSLMAPAVLLSELLRELDKQRINFRLNSAEGNLPAEVIRYLARVREIRTVVADDMANWIDETGEGLTDLHRDGYQFVFLADQIQHTQEHVANHWARA